MRIEEEDFIMEQVSDTSFFFDLELKVLVKEKIKGKVTGNENYKFKKAGYGMPLENCIKKIVLNRLNQKQEVYSLKEFMSEYKKSVEELKNLLK